MENNTSEKKYYLVVDRLTGKSIDIVNQLPDERARNGGLDYNLISEKEATKHTLTLGGFGIKVTAKT